MNAIIYIAIAIPLVGFLTRHLLVTRAQFNEAIREGKPSPTNRALITNGVLFIAMGLLIPLFISKKASDWPIMIAALFILSEGIWDLWHGIRLRRILSNLSPQKETEKPEPSLSL